MINEEYLEKIQIKVKTLQKELLDHMLKVMLEKLPGMQHEETIDVVLASTFGVYINFISTFVNKSEKHIAKSIIERETIAFELMIKKIQEDLNTKENIQNPHDN